VMGKNNWSYRGADGHEMRFIDFIRTPADAQGAKEKKAFANEWRDDAGGCLGSTYQACTERPITRTWIAPHDGKLRIEGSILADPGDGSPVTIMCNERVAWAGWTQAHPAATAHDLTISVTSGDAIRFTLSPAPPGGEIRVVWDPVITYIE